MGLSRAFSVGLGLVILGAGITFSGSAVARAKLSSPPPRAATSGDNNTVDCVGMAAGQTFTYPEGASAITVTVDDGVGDNSVGCFQVAFFDGMTRIGEIFQAPDDTAAAAARTVTVPNATIPTVCRTNGKVCTLHLRQLHNAAAGCAANPTALGTGTAGTFFSCGEFRVRQPAPPDAAVPVDASPPPVTGDSSTPSPTPGQDSGFTPIPVPEGTGGAKVSGLNPSDAESEGCSVGNVGAQTTVWGSASAFAGIVAMVGLGLRRRRNRR